MKLEQESCKIPAIGLKFFKKIKDKKKQQQEQSQQQHLPPSVNQESRECQLHEQQQHKQLPPQYHRNSQPHLLYLSSTSEEGGFAEYYNPAENIGDRSTSELLPKDINSPQNSGNMSTSQTFVDRIDPFAKRSLKKKSKKSQGSSRYRNSQDAELQNLPALKGECVVYYNYCD